ncbi:hypothetical protein H0O00_02815 [Candidatus Micrarchaeota archaeon]|nr:hypothetical protein [Candidatus Micrarchaeota archaeon]
MKNGNPATLAILAAAIVSLTIAEVALIGVGILPPVLSYSLGNLFFSLLRLALAVYGGLLVAKKGLGAAAFNGALLLFAGSLTLCIATLAGSTYLGRPILGLAAPDTFSMILLLSITVVENTLLGAVLAAIAAFVSNKLGKD